MLSESFIRDFFGMLHRTSFSEWAKNPRTIAMMERDSNQLMQLRKYREALEKIGADSPPNPLLPAVEAYKLARAALGKDGGR